MQNLVQVRKLTILDPDYIGKSLKPNNDNFIDGSSEHLLWVNMHFFF